MRTGLYIGRFQPFHLGHLSAVRQALKQVETLYIGIGSSQYGHTEKNPFTAEERHQIIRGSLEENGFKDHCKLFLIPDIHDDERWVEHVHSIIPPFDELFVGDEGIVKKLFEKAYPLLPITLVKHEVNISGSQIRQMMINGENWETFVTEGTVKIIKSLDLGERFKNKQNL